MLTTKLSKTDVAVEETMSDPAAEVKPRTYGIISTELSLRRKVLYASFVVNIFIISTGRRRLNVLKCHIITTEIAEMQVCSSLCSGPTVDVRASPVMVYTALTLLVKIVIMIMMAMM
jgi:hypothetical protein